MIIRIFPLVKTVVGFGTRAHTVVHAVGAFVGDRVPQVGPDIVRHGLGPVRSTADRGVGIHLEQTLRGLEKADAVGLGEGPQVPTHVSARQRSRHRRHRARGALDLHLHRVLADRLELRPDHPPPSDFRVGLGVQESLRRHEITRCPVHPYGLGRHREWYRGCQRGISVGLHLRVRESRRRRESVRVRVGGGMGGG